LKSTLIVPSINSSFCQTGLLSWPLVLAADPGGGGGSLTSFIILFGPLFLIWYFLVIRPQQAQKRKTQDMLANLKTGDRVVTSGGIYGTITGFRNGVVQLQVATQVKLDVARSAITALQASEDNEARKKEAEAKKKT
jgi:preprotein translocase subunit YajC